MVHEQVESTGDTPTWVFWVVLALVASLSSLLLLLSTLQLDHQALDHGAWDAGNPLRFPRLSDTDINRLPVRRYTGSETGNGSQEDLASRVMDDLACIGQLEVFDRVEEELKCIICWQQVRDNQEVKTLPCTHEFHAACIDEWLSDHPTCPLCRKRAYLFIFCPTSDTSVHIEPHQD